MSSSLQPVLEIAGIGTVLLFFALAGLVALMYALTSAWLFERLNPPTTEASEAEAREARVSEAAKQAKQEAAAEHDRQHQAVALAVAVACATVDRPLARVVESPSAWRRVHRARRFAQPVRRGRARS